MCCWLRFTQVCSNLLNKYKLNWYSVLDWQVITITLWHLFPRVTVLTFICFAHLFCLSASSHHKLLLFTYTMVSSYINIVVSSLTFDSYICSDENVSNSQDSCLFAQDHHMSFCAKLIERCNWKAMTKAAKIPNTSPSAKEYQQTYSYHWKIILMTKRNIVSNMSEG